MNDASSPSNNRSSLRVRHGAANFFIAGINIGGTSDFNMFMASFASVPIAVALVMLAQRPAPGHAV
jgi:hypothetical protein